MVAETRDPCPEYESESDELNDHYEWAKRDIKSLTVTVWNGFIDMYSGGVERAMFILTDFMQMLTILWILHQLLVYHSLITINEGPESRKVTTDCAIWYLLMDKYIRLVAYTIDFVCQYKQGNKLLYFTVIVLLGLWLFSGR